MRGANLVAKSKGSYKIFDQGGSMYFERIQTDVGVAGQPNHRHSLLRLFAENTQHQLLLLVLANG